MTMTTNGLEPEGYTLSGTDLAELRKSFRGELIGREHANYEVARRVWNGNVDLVLHPRGCDTSCTDCDRVCGATTAVGFRCDRTMVRRRVLRATYPLGARALDPAGAALARKGLHEPRGRGGPSRDDSGVFLRELPSATADQSCLRSNEFIPYQCEHLSDVRLRPSATPETGVEPA